MRTLAIIVALAAVPAAAQARSPASVEQLYVLDCGTATSPDFSQWSPGSNQGRPVVMSDHCYLIRHGSDWMLWDTGVDDRTPAAGKEVAHKVTGVPGPGLAAQLRQIGVRSDQIDIIAFSHAHFDHVGNARLFPRARWFVQRHEYRAMFGHKPQEYGFVPELYSGMKRNPVVQLDGDHDVFGDGSVTIVSTPGHTPGHQSLLVRLPRTGAIILSGDVAHSLENFERGRVPSFNADPIATKRSIDKLEALRRREKAQLWINHDRRQTNDVQGAPHAIE